MNIGYLSEHPAEYARDLRTCRTLEELKAFLAEWKPLASDALAATERMTEADFHEYRTGLAKESHGHSAGIEWQQRYAPIILPEVMFMTSLVADQFQVPWGTAFIRLKEEDYIVEDEDGIYIWTKKGEAK